MFYFAYHGRRGKEWDIDINRYRPIEIVFTDERDRKKERESSGCSVKSVFRRGRGVEVASSPLKRAATLVPRASAGFSTAERAPVFVYTRLQADLSGGWEFESQSGSRTAVSKRYLRVSRSRFSKSWKTRSNPFISIAGTKFEEIGGNWRKFRRRTKSGMEMSGILKLE